MEHADVDLDALAEAYGRALELEKAGALEAAAAAYREMLAIDPLDRGGASVRLAGIGYGETPDKAPGAYVAMLFDQHAETFDNTLVDQLGYSAPLELAEMMRPHLPQPCHRLLDLGCGTGLFGEAMERKVTHMTGIDLAEGMIEIAGEKELYDELYVGDVEMFLAETDAPPWDLIAATDLLPYLGRLDGLFARVARRLAPGGLFAFSTERLEGDLQPGFAVGPHHRFAHTDAYVAQLSRAQELIRLATQPIIVRYEEGPPVPGQLFVLGGARPSA